MTKLSALVLALAILIASAPVAYSQPAVCTLATPSAPGVAASGESELVEDILITCVSNTPPQSTTINVVLDLNVNLTSRIMNTATFATESLLLIDDPKPGVPNTSNGFPYFGQVLGTPGVPAGDPGSGNVYQGVQGMSGGGILENQVVFSGVPYVTGSTRTFRIVNTRADVAAIGANPVNADVAISSGVAIDVTNPVITVANGAIALKFSSGPLIGAVGLDLTFAERFPKAFRKRVENMPGGPLTLKRQDFPGTFYCTESGFIPTFVPLATGAIGVADTGTRLLAQFSAIPPVVTLLTVPNQVTSSSGALVAHRVLPPLGPGFGQGVVTTATGTSTVAVTPTQTADLLYEVTSASPYLGENGCSMLDTFYVSVIPNLPVSMTSTVVTGQLAPLSGVNQASATAREPRFAP